MRLMRETVDEARRFSLNSLDYLQINSVWRTWTLSAHEQIIRPLIIGHVRHNLMRRSQGQRGQRGVSGV